MTTSLPPRPGPIPSSLAAERGCPSFWQMAPADIEPPAGDAESHRGIGDRFLKDHVCGTKLACSAWADASEDDSEQPVTIVGRVESSYVADKDLPFNHSSHDWVINVATSDQFIGYHSDANPVTQAGERILHCEWEIGALREAFPFLPSTGDRVWVTGRWVFDCAHPDNCKTEIHPPEALASWRPETFIDRTSGDAVAGLRISCVVSGDGGPCTQRDSVTGTYEFSIHLPPSPGAGAHLVVQHEGNGPPPSVEPRFDNGEAYAAVQLPFAKGDAFPAETWVSNSWIGWSDPAQPIEHKTVTVTLKSLRILRTHDQRPVSEGEWNLWVSVNGRWQEIMRDRTVNLGEDVDLAGFHIPLVVSRPSVPTDHVISIESTGWEGDAIDNICRFEDGARRGIPQILDQVSVDQAKAWLMKQVGKLLNQRLTALQASHSWDEVSGAQTFTRHAGTPELADFELTYKISVL